MSLFTSRLLTAADVPAGSYAVYEPAEKRRDDGTTCTVYYRVSQALTLIDAAIAWNNHPRWVVAPYTPGVPPTAASVVPLSELMPHVERRLAELKTARTAVRS